MAIPKPLILVILDGFGISPREEGNPVASAHMPVFRDLEQYYPFTTLQASGVAVGLPWGEAGNSEVGHLTMGAGRVVYHHLPRIIHAIRDGSFFENAALKQAAAHVRAHDSRLHIAGLVSSGSVHSYLDHLEALLEFAKRENIAHVYIHAFTDGKDAPYNQGAGFLRALEERMKEGFPNARIATVMGRFFSMDRDEKWDRVQRAYDLMAHGTGEALTSLNLHEYLEAAYAQGTSDEFIEPAVLDPAGIIREHDALIFFNFREDSMREITRAFAHGDDFGKFPRVKIPDLFIATMTEYEKNREGVHALFPTLATSHTLGAVLSEAGLRQLRMAEMEKYAHVTYFFNGGEEAPLPGEDRILVPSKAVAHFDEAPEMRARDIAGKVIENMDRYDVMVVNFANADMVGHSGNFSSAVRAVEALDVALGEMITAIGERDGAIVITADHGNVEAKRSFLSGERINEHSTNPVPLILVGPEYRRIEARSDEEIMAIKKEVGGIVTDVAPTILALLGIDKPQEMTGQNLLARLLE